MKIIFGLGNIGNKYSDTRHNVGFHFVDYAFLKLGDCETAKEERSGLVYKKMLGKEMVLLVKPTTLMNRSGDCVKAFVDYYKVLVENILVVHDDLDIPLGGYKMQYKKGPKGHNGLIDIENKLGTENFLRLRFGIENRKDLQCSGEDYVLGRFDNDELVTIRETFVSAWDMVLDKFILGEKGSSHTK